MPLSTIKTKPNRKRMMVSGGRELNKRYTVGRRFRVTPGENDMILCEVTKSRGVRSCNPGIRIPFPAGTPLHMTIRKVWKPGGRSCSRWFIHPLKRKGSIVGYGARCVALLRLEQQQHLTITPIDLPRVEEQKVAA